MSGGAAGVWDARAIAIDLRHFRLPHGVEPTDAGREMLGKARVAVEAAEDALVVGQAGWEEAADFALDWSVRAAEAWS
jgi:hypothetical protein